MPQVRPKVLSVFQQVLFHRDTQLDILIVNQLGKLGAKTGVTICMYAYNIYVSPSLCMDQRRSLLPPGGYLRVFDIIISLHQIVSIQATAEPITFLTEVFIPTMLNFYNINMFLVAKIQYCY